MRRTEVRIQTAGESARSDDELSYCGEREKMMNVVQSSTIHTTTCAVVTHSAVVKRDGKKPPIFVRRGSSTEMSRDEAIWRRAHGRQPTVGRGGAQESKANVHRLKQWVCGGVTAALW